MPMDSIPMCSNTLYMYNVDAGSSLSWLSESTMTLYHHYDSTSDPERQNLSQVLWVWLFEATDICPWTAYQSAQTLCICLMCMWEAVWFGCELQPWHNDIILTPQVTQNPKSDTSSVGITVWGYCHMPMDIISMCSNTLFMSNVYVGSSLS